MSSRSTAAPARPQSPVLAQERREQYKVRLINARAGVAECRTRTRGKTARTEQWTVFETPEQFDGCAADDPLRFADPLMFGRINAEAEAAFQHRR